VLDRTDGVDATVEVTVVRGTEERTVQVVLATDAPVEDPPA
jgi:hypothetical protein